MGAEQVKDKYIFSLDIGTRSVMGVVSQKNDDKYTVLDYEIVEHPDRAMLDGQIHDIDKVAKVVGKVKSTLEERMDIVFSEVSIAAAGRALKTNQVSVSQELDPTKEIDVELMATLEMEGVQEAQNALSIENETEQLRYHCVGYSVINYFLDGTMIINPKGHRGSSLRADIVATFLPHIVVDSLYTVMGRCGLSVVSLTLEPIAAINISIPQKLRLLNLALVDVGAGTSDVAITKDGTILSYGMVDKAGDELTEALLKAFLLDFESAESLKIRLMEEESLEFTDIVGIRHKKTRDEILDIIKPSIESIVEAIANKINEINEKPPSAVFCIGGGCQIPSFVESLARAIDIPNERVVIKGTETLEGIEFKLEPLKGPEYITPLGIGFTKSMQQNQDFIQVMVNEVPVRLLNAKKLKISDALILVGFHARKLLSERGESFNVTVNGEPRRIAGSYGEPAKIWINGVPAGLGSEIANQDRIVVEPATSGKQKTIKLKEFIDLRSGVSVDNRRINFIQIIKVNGKIADGDYILSPNDKIEYSEIRNAGDLSVFLKMPYKNNMFIRNGKKLKHNSLLKNRDKLIINSLLNKNDDDKQKNNIEKKNVNDKLKLEEQNQRQNSEIAIKKNLDKDIKIIENKNEKKLEKSSGKQNSNNIVSDKAENQSKSQINTQADKQVKKKYSIDNKNKDKEQNKSSIRNKQIKGELNKKNETESDIKENFNGVDKKSDELGKKLEYEEVQKDSKIVDTEDYLSDDLYEDLEDVEEYYDEEELGYKSEQDSDYNSPFASRFERVQTYDYIIVVNGKTIEIRDLEREMVFVDIFNHIDFDLKNPKGMPELILNGKKARYTDKLKSGDVIKVGWKNK